MGGKLPPYSVSEEDGVPIVYQPWNIKFTNGSVTDNSDGTVSINVGSGTGGSIIYAPSGGYYIVQSNNTNLPNSQQLASLANGLLKNTSSTGILSIGSGGVDFENILTAGSPLLKIGNVFHVDTASATKNGYLQLADFNNFTAKANTSITISTVAPLAGGGNLSANRVISITTDGTTTNYLRGDGTYAIPASNSGIKLAVFTIYSSSTWTAENIPIFQSPYETPITIKQVNVTTLGSSPLLGFNLQIRPWGNLANTGSNIFISLQSAPSTGIEIITAISSSIVSPKAHILFSSSAIITGQVDYVTGSIYYIRNTI